MEKEKGGKGKAKSRRKMAEIPSTHIREGSSYINFIAQISKFTIAAGEPIFLTFTKYICLYW